jgi:erythromycin esterase
MARLTCLLAVLFVGASWTHAQEGILAQTDWIRRNAIPFKTVEAGHGFEDLLPLKQLIGDARIVSLGEPTHGSREVFQMKHRLLEFLVQEMGFSIFSIEANMPEAFRLNDYVLRGQGVPQALIRGMYFWTWQTEEVLEMVEWMRRHNAEPEPQRRGPKVTFTGFDVQTPDVAAQIVKGFVEKADSAYTPFVADAVKAAMAAEKRRTPDSRVVPGTSRSRTDPVKAAETWQAVVSRLELKREEDGKAGDSLSADWAIVNARLVKDSMDIRAYGASRGLPIRDRAMARMVGWILEQSPKAKIVLWAHNAHVQRQPRWMGRFLEEQFPGEMVALGFATGEGTYRAISRLGRGLMNLGLAKPPSTSFESAFQATGLPRFILDLRKAVADSPHSGWLLDSRPFRSIGSMEMKQEFQPHRIHESFDGVVWIQKTTAALALRN